MCVLVCVYVEMNTFITQGSINLWMLPLLQYAFNLSCVLVTAGQCLVIGPNHTYSYTELLVTLCHSLLVAPSAVRTVFNVAPSQAGLGQEYFEATDILCLNESEVSCEVGMVSMKCTIPGRILSWRTLYYSVAG